MTDWRSSILLQFPPGLSRVTIVADPDELLTEPIILQEIRRRGYEVVIFDESISFRYAYETRFRSRWDGGDESGPALVVRLSSHDFNSLPFDLLQGGRRVSFRLSDMFPKLSYPVVAALDRSSLDPLYQAYLRHDPGELGEKGTKDFVLRHVYEIAPEIIKTPAGLLRILLRLHYRNQHLPQVLTERLVSELKVNEVFKDWPIEHILPHRESFFSFLQERWPLFLDRYAGGDAAGIAETQHPYAFTFSGPAELPFDHDDVRVYLDNLFFEGLLQPVIHPKSSVVAGTLFASGVRIDPTQDRQRRLEGLLGTVEREIPGVDAQHYDWLTFAHRWAEFSTVWIDAGRDMTKEVWQRCRTVRDMVDAQFLQWMKNRYAGLFSQPPSPPVLLHHLPRRLSRELREQRTTKIALVVVDGLSLDQWIPVRETLQERQEILLYEESAIFALVPTITSVSRQALFAGKAPFYFRQSIGTTDKEAALWTAFWAEHGVPQNGVAYFKGLGDGNLDAIVEAISSPSIRVVGLVIDKVDRIMHGMELGASGMHNQIRQWASQGYLADLCDILLDHEFQVTLTSDHGNIEAVGIGSPREGALAEKRGERVRMYSDHILRAKIEDDFPNVIEWPPVGLPDDFLPLLAPRRTAFVQIGKMTVCHGGITIDEVIVPLIRIRRKPS